VGQRNRQERPRAQLRHRTRTVQTDSDRLERLATQLPGASGERPFSVATASVIAVKARALRCFRCEGELDVGEDSAQKVNHEILRRVELTCRQCRVARVAWFRIVPVLPS
jgi:hypothetical protein